MSVYTIYYQNGAKMMRPVKSRQEYLALRDSEQNRRADKMHMVQMNYSCLPKGVNADTDLLTYVGPLKGAELASDTVGMDIDFDKQDPDYVQKMQSAPELIMSKKDELGLLMLERSASKGYHIVFRRRFTEGIAEGQLLANQERNLRWASDLLGVAFDKGAKDITRVFFTTTADADHLLYLDDALFTITAVGVAQGARRTAEPPGTEAQNDTADAKGINVSASEHLTQAKPAINATAINAHASEPLTGVAPINAHNSEPLTYLGIEYSQIIKKWWYLYNNGMEPCPGNRNTLTFELAVNLRHICGFDRDLMNKVIPDYWAQDTNKTSPLGGEREGLQGSGARSEKLACIDSALNERRTQMPARLKNVLAALRQENLHNAEIVSAIDEAQLRDDSYYYTAFPKGALAMGMADSVGAVGPTMVMPIIAAVCPYVGALATDVQIEIHGKFNSLNLISYISGEFASGKGDIDPVVEVWGSEIQAMDDLYLMQEDEWRAKKRKAKNAKEQPEEPRLPIRILPLNNTVANLAERLARTQGKHAISYTPEADTVATKWKSSMSDFSVMLRQAYDASRYDREARSADAVNVHIKNLRWNVVMCGTPDALYRVVSNYTDGFQSRIAVARTPDNTFAPLDDEIHVLTDHQAENIRQVAHLLTLLSGKVKLPKLEKKSREWVENVRLDSLKDNDRVMARQRMRVCVTAMRMTACLMLCQVCEKLIRQYGVNGAETRLRQTPDMWMELMHKAQTPAMLQAYDVIADMLLDNNLYFFRDRIEQAFQSRDYVGQNDRRRRGKNDTIFSLLGAIFSFEQAYHQAVTLKGNTVTPNSVRMMLKNWTKQGLVSLREDGMYVKLT